jgi:hypothetical protein
MPELTPMYWSLDAQSVDYRCLEYTMPLGSRGFAGLLRPPAIIGIVNMSIDILEKKTIRSWINLNQLYNIPAIYIYIIYHGHLVDVFNPSQQEAQQLFVIVDLQKSPQLPPPLSPRRGWASPAIVNHLVSNLTKPCLAWALEVGMTRAKNALVGDPCMSRHFWATSAVEPEPKGMCDFFDSLTPSWL